MEHMVIESKLKNHGYKVDGYMANFILPTRSFLFYHNYDFWLITHNGELDSLDAKSDLIREISKGKIYIEDAYVIYNNNGRVPFDQALKEERLRGLNLRRYVREVNYSYYAGHRQFVITTNTKYIERCVRADIIKENYEKSKIYLKSNGYSCLMKELDNLYKLNEVISYPFNLEYQLIKNIETLIKKIKNESKH